MSNGKQQASDSGKPGESKVFLLSAPTTGQSGSGGLPEAERGGRDKQGLPNHHGEGSLCSLTGVLAWAVAACWHHWACNGPLPSTPSSHVPQPAQQAQSRTLGTALKDTEGAH